MHAFPFRRSFLFLFTTLLGVGLLSCGSARQTVVLEKDWEMLGQQKVNFVRDKDEIDVTSDQRFTAVRFRVEDRAVRINDLTIFFTNGDKLEPSIDDEIAADQYSRVIELNPEGRTIDKIEFRYRTTGNVLKGRANVLVLGKRYNPYGY
ncbi:MAG: hypothetical protein JWP27_1730 [Flaviaesturariibacter sp.]|nr:hypothetical protein [Flaviaesturariibacter sp.]